MSCWLVTGSAGFVGSHVLAHLQRQASGTMAIVAPSRADLDLADGEALRAFLRRHRVTGIIHLAASVDRANTPEAERHQWRNTFESGRTVIEEASSLGVQHVIAAGSVEELGNSAGALDVEQRTQPATLYGLCKSLVREYAEYAARRGRIRIDWFRPFVVYGPGQRGTMVIPSAFRAAVTGEPCDFSDGVQQRDFLFVEDLARWIAAATRLAPDARFRLHHLGTGTAVPVRAVLDGVRDEFPSAPLRIGARPRRAGEPLLQVAPPYRSDEPALSTWTAEVGIREGLRRTAAWWREEAARS